MSVESVLARGRKRAKASTLTDRCAVDRPTGLAARDPVSGDQLPTVTTIATNRQCRIQQASRLGLLGQVSRRQTAGREARIVRMSIQFPFDGTPPVLVGDIVRITAIGPKTDDEVLGKSYKLVSPVHKSHSTTLRYEVEEVTG